MSDRSQTGELLVDAKDLTQALRAVAPFTLDKVDDLSRVRFLAAGPNLYLSATNGSAAALAVVSLVTDARSTDPLTFELLGSQAKEVAALFKPARGPAGEEEQQHELRVDVHAEDVTVTDAGGMFDGKQYTMPRPAVGAHVRPLELVMLSRLAVGHRPAQETPPKVSPALLGLVVKAAAVYGAELVCEDLGPQDSSSAGAVLYRVGESLLATVRQTWLDESEAADRDRWRSSWVDRLTALGVIEDQS